MTLNMKSDVGFVRAYQIDAAKYADLSPGYAYAIVLENTTGADITAGTVTVQTADADPSNPCVPDAAGWANLQVEPDCDAPPGSVAADATITISAQNPIVAGGQCQYAAPCPKQFIRLAAAPPAGIVAMVVLTRLRHPGLPANPAFFAPR